MDIEFLAKYPSSASDQHYPTLTHLMYLDKSRTRQISFHLHISTIYRAQSVSKPSLFQALVLTLFRCYQPRSLIQGWLHIEALTCKNNYFIYKFLKLQIKKKKNLVATLNFFWPNIIKLWTKFGNKLMLQLNFLFFIIIIYIYIYIYI